MRIEIFLIYNLIFFIATALTMKTNKFHRAILFTLVALLILMGPNMIIPTVLDNATNISIVRELTNTTLYVNGSDTITINAYTILYLDPSALIYFYLIWLAILAVSIWETFPWRDREL